MNRYALGLVRVSVATPADNIKLTRALREFLFFSSHHYLRVYPTKSLNHFGANAEVDTLKWIRCQSQWESDAQICIRKVRLLFIR